MGFPHVNSEPVLRADKWDGASTQGEGSGGGGGPLGQGGGDGATGEAGEDKGKGIGGVVDQAPKSEPKKGSKGKATARRASAGASAAGAKPGRLAKIMSKWLYPEAKVGFICWVEGAGADLKLL